MHMDYELYWVHQQAVHFPAEFNIYTITVIYYGHRSKIEVPIYAFIFFRRILLIARFRGFRSNWSRDVKCPPSGGYCHISVPIFILLSVNYQFLVGCFFLCLSVALDMMSRSPSSTHWPSSTYVIKGVTWLAGLLTEYRS
jgi:hypothetical protein